MIDELIETNLEQPEKMPSLKYSFSCAEILRQMMQNEAIQPLPELTLDIENGLTPDISVYRHEEIKIEPFEDELKVKQMPVLAVEVVPSSQTIQALREKSKVMKNAGIAAVWTVEPYLKSVLVSDADGERVYREETVESENISVDFSKVFR